MKIERDAKTWWKKYNEEMVLSMKETSELLELLNSVYSITTHLRFNIRANGFARYGTYEIILPKANNKIKEYVILHEFSHLLSYKKYGIVGEGHRKLFYDTLKEIALLYYGDINKYPWICEYKSIYNRYVREFEYQKKGGDKNVNE